MKYVTFVILLLIGCQSEQVVQELTVVDRQDYSIIHEGDTLSTRSVVALGDNEAVFGCSSATVARVQDGHVNFHIGTGAGDHQYRSIAHVDGQFVFANAGSPALFFRTELEKGPWHIAHKDTAAAAFYNTIAFWNDKEGIVTGDPQQDSFPLMTTSDSGRSWQAIDKEVLPSPMEGEANFAASNTCIAVSGERAWIATGGKSARVLRTLDKGKSWEAFDTPIVQGEQMTGIFSIDFFDDNTGVIIGGDWNSKEKNVSNKALSTDGGETWNLIADGNGPGYRSVIKFHPKGNGKVLIAAGSEGVDYSLDQGQTWTRLLEQGYYTMSFSPSGKVLWLGGREKLARLELDLS